MKHRVADLLMETAVAVAASARADYGSLETPVLAPELPSPVTSMAAAALRELFLAWGLDAQRAGTPRWNPLVDFIVPGSRVVLKPNWVLHYNQSGCGLDCLLTHISVIEAVLEYVALARPGPVIIGDAPIQGCDFEALRIATGIDERMARFRERGLRVELCDFRRTVLPGADPGSPRMETGRGMERYVLVDLGKESLLEPIAADSARFRVTMYDPDALARSHSPGRHQYLIAREVLEADTVISLPKLKCHKKACLTGALKNLVGINGNKEYLPHHRKGGSGDGGDCYPGRSWVKRQAEEAADAANRRSAGWRQRLLSEASEALLRVAARLGGDEDIEGSWYGNDTVWRTVLDLQRILKYASAGGEMAPEPQRRVVHITDAIVGGEGEGPLAPTPVASGFLTGAVNPAAAEWINARMMGFDPDRIPLVREAFRAYPYPLANFSPGEI
ncbi:MAG TPA: DUF362 domain-containing protein, partial [Bryobacteraceae bacterium]|nr:DUF362 domain-containing protein [Bryobacteraceae bacterium]